LPLEHSIQTGEVWLKTIYSAVGRAMLDATIYVFMERVLIHRMWHVEDSV
jgi:hypothetical protein